MASPEKLSTLISTKNQVVEDAAEGILLKSAPAFAPTQPKNVFASLPYKGRPKTLEEMDPAPPRFGHLSRETG